MSKKISPISGDIPRTYIREWREWKGYTLDDVARMIGATPPTLSRVETGKGMLTWGVINAIAEAIDENAYDILFRDPRAEGIEEFISELRRAPLATQHLIAQLGRTVITHEELSSDVMPSLPKLPIVNQKRNV